MRTGALYRGASLLVGLLSFLALPATAQDCGSTCHQCGIMGYEGRDHLVGGEYNMTCFNNLPYCVACPHQTSVRAESPRAAEVAELIQSAAPSQLNDILVTYRDRLLVSTTRHLVVLLGSECDPHTLASVIFLAPERARLLQALAVRRLDEYLAAPPPSAVSARD